MEVNEELGNLLLKFEHSEEFEEVWEGFVKTDMINSGYSFKQICSQFFAFGAMDMIKKYIAEDKK
jgi:hypothetical protein